MLAVVFWNARRVSSNVGEYANALAQFHRSLNEEKPKGFRFSASFRVDSVPWFEPKCEVFEDWYVLANFAAMDALDEYVVASSSLDSHRFLMKNTAGASGGIYYLSKGAANLDGMSHANWLLMPRAMTVEELIHPVKQSDDDFRYSYWTRAMALGPTENCLLTNAPASLPKDCRAKQIERELFWSPTQARCLATAK